MIESKIKDLENQLVEAIKKSDIAILDQMLHNDLLFLAPNGQLITKAIDIASHQAGQMIVEELILTIEEINIINDNAIAIVVYSKRHYVRQSNTRTISIYQNVETVYRRHKSNWR